MPPPPPRVGRRYAAIDQSSVDRLKDEVGAVQGFRCHPCWLVRYVRLELPCPKSCLVVASADPEPWTTMDDLVSGLKALESRLGYNSPPVPLKQPPEWSSVLNNCNIFLTNIRLS
ncbi:hypothetical protein BHM03_00027415 [Ensete ventricosum]|nr:hypothetical protein BHM03_00027415 [Ensete ventricosum]